MYVRNVWFRGTKTRDSPVCAPLELHMICLLYISLLSVLHLSVTYPPVYFNARRRYHMSIDYHGISMHLSRHSWRSKRRSLYFQSQENFFEDGRCRAFDAICDGIQSRQHCMFFVEGRPGRGKTFMVNAVNSFFVADVLLITCSEFPSRRTTSTYIPPYIPFQHEQISFATQVQSFGTNCQWQTKPHGNASTTCAVES
ncbi:hypothetical protein F4604DRAFT_729997 [Suillus subluteus]|nr:hypothetical protein F4604DRAFT_729997 [Suillus subluteus]